MRTIASRLFALLVTNLIIMQAALAAPVTWTLTDVVFADGGTVTGSFVYDADTDAFSAVSISSPSLPPPEGEVKDPILFGGLWNDCASYTPLVAGRFGLQCAAPTAGSSLRLVFDTALGNEGGTLALQPTSGPRGSMEVYTTGEGTIRAITGGSLVGSSVVPIPAAAWLFGSALAGLGFTRRRRR